MYPSPLPDPLASARIRSIARGLTLLAALACVQAHAATKYPTASGQAQSAAILADTEGTSVTSSLLQRSGHVVEVLEPRSFRTLPCPTYPEIRLAWRPYRRLAAQLSALDPDSVHIATEGPLGIAARRWCIPVSYTHLTLPTILRV